MEALLVNKSLAIDYKSGRDATWKYIVETTDANISEAEVIFAPGLPLPGQSHPNDPGSLVAKISANQRLNEPYFWDVEVKYISALDFPEGAQPVGAPRNNASPTNRAQNPTDRLPVWKFGSRTVNVPVQRDRLGIPYVNTAGQPYDPPIEIEVAIPTIDITTNHREFDPSMITYYTGAVNLDPWYRLPTGSVMVKGVTPTQMWENGIPYWQFSWQLEVAPSVDPWLDPDLGYGVWEPIRVLNTGYYQKVAGELEQMTDKYLNPLAAPALLDEAGVKTTTAFYSTFSVHSVVSFDRIP